MQLLLLQLLSKQEVAAKAKQLNSARQATLAALKACQASDLLSSMHAQKAWFLKQCIAGLSAQ